MDQLSLQYPAWYILLCVLLGLIFATVLYYKDERFREKSSWLNWLLGSLRFLLVALASFFLLSPLLKNVEKQTKKPIVVIAQDASESMANSLDDKGRLPASLQSLADRLSADFDVELYSFGSEVRSGLDTAMSDKVSNLTDMLKTVDDLYSGENLGAVVLASDGIFNEGSNPIYYNGRFAVPIYTVALGDTIPKKDLLIKRAFHNKIAYLGDQFSVQVDIGGQNSAGAKTRLEVYKIEGSQRTLLQQKDIDIDRGDFFTTEEIVLDAAESGMQRYRFVLSGIAGESSQANNRKDIFVDVLDARQKILLLADSPHPDLSALKQSIETNKNYEVEIAAVTKFKGNLEAFDFVILHQLPSRTNNISSILNTLNQNKTPRWYIAGMQTDFSRLDEIQNLLSLNTEGRDQNEVQARIAPGFNFFTIDEDLKGNLPNYPPLISPFGEFSEGPGSQTLLYQRIRKIDTQFPLLVMGEDQGIRTGILLGEGVWKWRLFDFLQNEQHEEFDAFLSKIVQFVSLKEDKRQFRVSLPKNIFDENESILMNAELYNKSFELINDPDVSIELTDAEGKDFTYVFNKSGKAYDLNAGILPVGSYRFEAEVNPDGERLTFNGQFSVQPIQLESYETTADHRLLRLLSERYGGSMVSLEEVTQLEEIIQAEETIAPVIYSTTKNKPLINLRWLFFVLLLLLSAEWFLRRYFGSY